MQSKKKWRDIMKPVKYKKRKLPVGKPLKPKMRKLIDKMQGK